MQQTYKVNSLSMLFLFPCIFILSKSGLCLYKHAYKYTIATTSARTTLNVYYVNFKYNCY